MTKPEPPLTPVDLIRGLHISYCQESGNEMSLTIPRMDQWSRWSTNGWTAADLRLVIKYIRTHFYDPARPHIMRSMMAFKKLVCGEERETHTDYTYFEQLLCDAKASQRNHKPAQSPKAIVMREANLAQSESQGEPKRVDAVAKEILDAGYSNMRKALE